MAIAVGSHVRSFAVSRSTRDVRITFHARWISTAIRPARSTAAATAQTFQMTRRTGWAGRSLMPLQILSQWWLGGRTRRRPILAGRAIVRGRRDAPSAASDPPEALVRRGAVLGRFDPLPTVVHAPLVGRFGALGLEPRRELRTPHIVPMALCLGRLVTAAPPDQRGDEEHEAAGRSGRHPTRTRGGPPRRAGVRLDRPAPLDPSGAAPSRIRGPPSGDRSWPRPPLPRSRPSPVAGPSHPDSPPWP